MKKLLTVILFIIILPVFIPTACVSSVQQTISVRNDKSIRFLVNSSWNEGNKYSNNNINSIKNKNLETLKSMDIKKNNRILVHNNGKPIDSDITIDNNENKLFAVYVNSEGNNDIISYYLTNTQEVNEKKMINDFLNSVNSEMNRIETATIELHGKIQPTYRIYNWDLKDKNKITVASFVQSINFNRVTNNSNINGRPGSVWEIKSYNKVLDKTGVTYIASQTNKIDVGYEGQNLFSWGQSIIDKNRDDYMYDINSKDSSISSPLKGFSIEDSSDMANKYTKSLYKYKFILREKSLITKKEVKVSNTGGNLALKINNVFEFNNSSNNTGIIEVFISDR